MSDVLSERLRQERICFDVKIFFLLMFGGCMIIWFLLSMGKAMSSQSRILLVEKPLGFKETDRIWDFYQRPSINATGHLIFHTVGSLLQHWPNTLYRNGHTMVPGIIPPGTFLYHGSPINQLPNHRIWLATDPEHANYFCLGEQESGCWQSTFMTTRSLNILYFDGTSAGKMLGGTMDSQDLVAWGRLRPECTQFGELFRIKDLCDWGSKYGLDGFLRMEFDFEIMICDLQNNGLETVSHLNLPYAGPPLPPPPKPTGLPLPMPTDCGEIIPPPPPSPPHPSFKLDLKKHFLVTESGSWHNHYPGEFRVKLDLSRLVSFYDTDSFPSLVSGRFRQDRWNHRLEGISKDDVDGMYKRLEGVLGQGQKKVEASGVDWSVLVRMIMDRYGKRLEMLQYILQGKSIGAETNFNWTATAIQAHDYLTAMLNSYITLDVIPSAGDAEFHDLTFRWATPVFKECATSYTSVIEKRFSSRFTPSELLILNSVKATNWEICRTMVRAWAEGIVLKSYGFQPETVNSGSVKEVVERWKKMVTGLMDWLGWDIWITCSPACGPEELCYLPAWPFFYSNHTRPRGPPPPGQEPHLPPEAEGPPRPFCIHRLPPFPKVGRSDSATDV